MRLDDFRVGDTNTTFTVDYMNENTFEWEQFTLGRYRYLFPEQLDDALEDLKQAGFTRYRVFEHTTKRIQ